MNNDDDDNKRFYVVMALIVMMLIAAAVKLHRANERLVVSPGVAPSEMIVCRNGVWVMVPANTATPDEARNSSRSCSP